jgi:hypothetical protein
MSIIDQQIDITASQLRLLDYKLLIPYSFERSMLGSLTSILIYDVVDMCEDTRSILGPSGTAPSVEDVLNCRDILLPNFRASFRASRAFARA